MTPQNRPLRLLALGHLGGRNLGDEAMFMALRKLAPTDRVVNWLVPVPNPDTAPDYGPNVALLPYSGRRILAELLRCHACLVCGGTSFHDQYEGAAHRRHVTTMAKFVALLAAARMLGRPVLLLGIGIGPFSRVGTTRLTRIWARLANRVIVRDRKSHTFLSESGLHPPRLALACDLVQFLAPALSALPPEPAAAGSVLVNVMDPAAFRGSNPAEVARLHTRLVSALVAAHPAARFEVTAVGVGGVDNDHNACAAFAEALRQEAPGTNVDILTLTDPEAFAARAKAAAAVIATRLHAAVLAHLAGARVLSVVYHPKIPAVFETLAPDRMAPLALIAPGDGTDPAEALAQIAAVPTIPNLPDRFTADRAVYAEALFGHFGATEGRG